MSLSQEPLPTPGRPATDISSLVLQKIGWKHDYFVSRRMFLYVCMYVLYICPCKPIYVSHVRVYDDMVSLHFFTHTKYTDIYVCNDVSIHYN